jgi:cell filamentation protein, protein adenylyltransferase
MSFDPKAPFNGLPLLPPKGDLENKVVLKACVEARAALASLKQATALIPNPTVLINTIPLLEAQASSAIENVVTTTDALFRLAQLQENGADPQTKEALRYRTALRHGCVAINKIPLNTRIAEEICTIIKDVRMTVRRVPGTALAHEGSGAVIYTPPVGENLLRDKLANWERFVNLPSDLDPLVRMAIAHYQFEAIYPFTDGNGRTGRILNLLILVQYGLLDSPVLYLSRYIIRNKRAYYDLLLQVTKEEAWQEWLLYMLRATADTATWTIEKIRAIRELAERTADIVKKRLPKIYSKELIEAIFVQPYTRIENLTKAGIAKRQTASVYLNKLAQAKVLSSAQFGRNKLFVNPAFLRLLTKDDADE